MSNSSLVNYTLISPMRHIGRNHIIDTITIHCVVGQCSVEALGYLFQTKQASSNYGVGYDGRIGMYVEEKDRSWCTSSAENDNRAVTIEVASDTFEPLAVNDKAYNALINLVADICKRNGIKKLVWSTNKSERMNHLNGCNLTVHRDYDYKSCPGTYLYDRQGDIAKKVNALISGNVEPIKPTYKTVDYSVKITAKDGLRLRKEPNTICNILTVLDYGAEVKLTKTTADGTWGYCKYGSYNGWIALEYTSKVTPTPTPEVKVPFLVKVSIDDLRIRTGASIYSNIVKYCPPSVYTIVEVKEGAGSTKGWGRLKAGGWISLDFVTKI